MTRIMLISELFLFYLKCFQDLRNTEGRHQTVEEAIRRLTRRQEELGNIQMDTIMNAVDEKYAELSNKVTISGLDWILL